MRVACPECAAEYELPPEVAARLAPGRAVRCARCGASWAPVPEEAPGGESAAPAPALDDPEPEPPPVGPAEPIAAPALAAPRRGRPAVPQPGGRGAALGWVATAAVLLLAAGAAWHWRVALVQAWPPLARAYMALGLG